MAATWGQLRFEVSKFAPGEDLALVTQWLNDAYEEILDHYNWKGLEKDATLQTTAPYITGTVSITPGTNTVAGAGTTWTPAMTGRLFRVAGDNQSYVFTYVSASSATLDRNYEGDANNDAVAAAGYTLYQATYELPSDVKYIQSLWNTRLNREIVERTRVEIGQMSPSAIAINEPLFYAPVADSAESSPPVLHAIELYPIPQYAAGYPYTYQKAAVGFVGSNTASSPMPWVSTPAIAAGAKSRCLSHRRDYAGAAAEAARALRFREQMVSVESRRNGPSRITMADRYTRHRLRRWRR